MNHPLQDLFDEADRRAIEPCPSCGFQNVQDWRQCAECSLLREDWRTRASSYYRARECPECKGEIRSDSIFVWDVEAALCDSEWCDLVRDSPELRRHPCAHLLCIYDGYYRAEMQRQFAFICPDCLHHGYDTEPPSRCDHDRYVSTVRSARLVSPNASP